ncbi:MAG: nucleoside hydrolase [bacterium]|nr:nucleoside hydrolase [bacterium]
MLRYTGLMCLLSTAAAGAAAQDLAAPPERPVRFIFDTDMGNDVDDALALGVIHALQSRGECELLAVTITKDHDQCAAYIDAVNTFYGRPGVPIGVCRPGPTPQQSKFTVLADTKDDGTLRYPHDLMSGKDAPEAVEVLRKALAAQPDNSVAIAQVGFSTNLARLLESKADAHSDLDGRALVAKKVSVLSVMAGAFALIDGKEHREYNVVKDIPAAQKLAADWPTPIVYSGFEIGKAIRYPAASIDRDYAYVDHHILAESYQLYMPTPHERPTWDLTSVLWAVRPDRGYFDLSEPGRVTVNEKGKSVFAPAADGPHRYLIVDEEQIARTREALAQLSSQPPDALPR